MKMQVVMGPTLKMSYFKPENLFAHVVRFLNTKNHCIMIIIAVLSEATAVVN